MLAIFAYGKNFIVFILYRKTYNESCRLWQYAGLKSINFKIYRFVLLNVKRNVVML